MEPRQLAMDPPPRSAALTLGRHLLGRIYKPDPRDWKLSRLMELAEPGDGTLDMTVQQVLDQTPYFTTWPNYLVFWRWVKQRKKGPKPAPTGDTTPGWELKSSSTRVRPGTASDSAGPAGSTRRRWRATSRTPTGTRSTTSARSSTASRSPRTARTFGPVRSRSATAAGSPHSPSRENTNEIDDWINNNGPVVVGTAWTDDMFSPDSNGLVKPTGAVAGGHCYLMLEEVDADDTYVFQNSWGASWGHNGRFKMKRGGFRQPSRRLGRGLLRCGAAALTVS